MIKKNNIKSIKLNDLKSSLNTDDYTSNSIPPKTDIFEISNLSGYQNHSLSSNIMSVTPHNTFASNGSDEYDEPLFTVTKSSTLTNISCLNALSFNDGRSRGRIEFNNNYLALKQKNIQLTSAGGALVTFTESTGSYSSGSLVVTGVPNDDEIFTIKDCERSAAVNDGLSKSFVIDTSVSTVDGSVKSGTAVATDVLNTNTPVDGDSFECLIETVPLKKIVVIWKDTVGTATGDNIHISTVGSAATRNANMIALINGTSDASVSYGPDISNATTDGIKGITATAGSSNKVTLTQDSVGSGGFIFNKSGSNCVNSGSLYNNQMKGGYKDAVIVGLSGVTTNNGRAGRFRSAINNWATNNSTLTGSSKRLQVTAAGSTNNVDLTQDNDGIIGNTNIANNLSNVTVTDFTNTSHFDVRNNLSSTINQVTSAINSNANFRAYRLNNAILIFQETAGASGNGKSITTSAPAKTLEISSFNGGGTAQDITIINLEGQSTITSLNRNSYTILSVHPSYIQINYNSNTGTNTHTANTGYVYVPDSLDNSLKYTHSNNNFNLINLLNQKIDRLIDATAMRVFTFRHAGYRSLWNDTDIDLPSYGDSYLAANALSGTTTTTAIRPNFVCSYPAKVTKLYIEAVTISSSIDNITFKIWKGTSTNNHTGIDLTLIKEVTTNLTQWQTNLLNEDITTNNTVDADQGLYISVEKATNNYSINFNWMLQVTGEYT